MNCMRLRTTMFTNALCGMMVAALMLSSSFGSAELVMVYSIQRHGARNVLPKSSLLSENQATGGPTLLPQGQRQCYEAGLAFSNRYINPNSCSVTDTCLAAPDTGIQYGVVGKPGVGFSNYNTYANTSALDRTIMSADSFLGGVFPPINNASSDMFLPTGQQLVPVYSIADSEDWRIRGYTKCPEYQQRLQAWLSSDDFQAKEAETAEFRNEIQQLAPQLNVSLANWWNVYDAFNVWRTYQVGDAMPEIDEQTYSKMVDLAMWLETSKMRPELTGNLLGGGLLGDLLHRLQAAQAARTQGSPDYYRLLTISSHYNTQLGLISALQSSDKKTSYLWQRRIPSLAAVLVFELHVDTAVLSSSSGDSSADAFVVRAVYQDGPKARYAVLPLPCAERGDAAEQLVGPGSCTLESFLALAQPQAFMSSRDWCDACNNKDVLACEVARIERQLAEVGADGRGKGRNSSNPAMVAVWVLTALILVGLLVPAVVYGVMRYRRRRQQPFIKDTNNLDGTRQDELML